jgi:hypothetical protein
MLDVRIDIEPFNDKFQVIWNIDNLPCRPYFVDSGDLKQIAKEEIRPRLGGWSHWHLKTVSPKQDPSSANWPTPGTVCTRLSSRLFRAARRSRDTLTKSRQS